MVITKDTVKEKKPKTPAKKVQKKLAEALSSHHPVLAVPRSEATASTTRDTESSKIKIPTPPENFVPTILSLADIGKKRYIEGIGRRKTATARVRLYPGKGQWVVNAKAGIVYFSKQQLQTAVSPLVQLRREKEFDVSIKVSGGGPVAQAVAVRHGLSRALLLENEAHLPVLKPLGFLTRDPRAKERKKFGLKRARRAPQFSKR